MFLFSRSFRRAFEALCLASLIFTSSAYGQSASGAPNPPDNFRFGLPTEKTYIFGHSLINHEHTEMPTPSNELSVPHWMFLLAQTAGSDFRVNGQYGFLYTHADLPPRSQWGFDLVSSNWEPDDRGESFSDVDFSSVMITAANFIQHRGPDEVFEVSGTSGTPLSATLAIIDWVNAQEPGIAVYIYENWPDMGGYMSAFPPTQAQFSNYNNYLLNDFHQWWETYYASLVESRPDFDIKMIPVGPIMARLLTQVPYNTIPLTELYEDSAPHGRPTIYFLAGLVTYMSIYGVIAPLDYEPPAIIHSTVRDNYSAVVNFIWSELNASDYNLDLNP